MNIFSFFVTTWAVGPALSRVAGLPHASSPAPPPAAAFGDADAEAADEDPLCPRFAADEDADAAARRRTTLNVHLVPHTHDDVGWLKTPDQYFYGWNNTIQQAHVGQILDSVLAALSDPHTAHDRTFTYVETKFFEQWYRTLPPPLRASLQGLVDAKKLSFANGGWCMHDEATTHFMGMIDQTALGHRFLKETLGVVPAVGWQIDPFGHSATQAGPLTAGVGFDALYFGRMHYVDLERRQRDAECEGLWAPAAAAGAADAGRPPPVFWGLSGSYGGNYGGPEGLCFDALCADDPLVGQGDEALLARIRNFTEGLAVQAGRTKGRDIMLTMGMDFQYSQASKNFKNMDRLIEATNHFLTNGAIAAADVFGERFTTVNVFYSTPERYTRCKHADLVWAARTGGDGNRGAPPVREGAVPAAADKHDPTAWRASVKTGDFFPYADCDHCYWTGYFTSRPGLKRLERAGSAFLHAARQVEALAALRAPGTTVPHRSVEEGTAREAAIDIIEEGVPWLEGAASAAAWSAGPLHSLDDAVAIAQHHDAVTGTSKQHVAYDYAKRIAGGMHDAGEVVAGGLRKLLLHDPTSEWLGNLRHCHLLNETVCGVSQDASEDASKAIYVVVYNALAHERDEAIPLPVNAAHYVVERLGPGTGWSAVASSLVPNPNHAGAAGAAGFTLHFSARGLPPLGASVFRVRRAWEHDAPVRATPRGLSEEQPSGHLRRSPKVDVDESPIENDLMVSNGVLSVSFDRSTGVIKAISEQREGGVSLSLTQEYGFYEAFFHKDSPPAATAWTTVFEAGDSRKRNGVCLPGYADAEGDEMPWLLGSAQQWQNEGAYVFRPTPDQASHIVPPRAVAHLVVYESELVTEVHAEFGSAEVDGTWIKQITRLIDGKNYVEVEYAVGPVPIADGAGKSVFSRYSTTIESEGEFYTDSNAREFMKRKRADTEVFGYSAPDLDTELEPIAGNYYPVNTAMFIDDGNRSFGVLVDRSQGGSSLSDGALELMIQRRILHDDDRGVGEALNETDVGITPCPPFGNATRLGTGVVTKGTHRLTIGKGGASHARSQMDRVFSPPLVFAASAPVDVRVPFRKSSLSMLETSLPENVMVVTFAALEKGSFLVRLAHQYDVAESDVHSAPAVVDLCDLFPTKEIASVTEKTLSGNQDRSAWEKRRLRWDFDTPEGSTEEERLDDETRHAFLLKPLEIRTFEVRVHDID